MSRVVDINSRRLFGEFYPQSPETIPETVSFFGGALATFVAPTAAYCYVTSQIQSLVILAAQILVGLLLAAVMKKRKSVLISCVPAIRSERSYQQQDRDAA